MVTRPHSLLPEFPGQDAGVASGMRPGVKSGLSEGRLADGSFRAGDGAEVATQASTRWKGKSEDRRAEPSRSAACPPSLSPLRAGRGPSHGGRRPVLVPSPPLPHPPASRLGVQTGRVCGVSAQSSLDLVHHGPTRLRRGGSFHVLAGAGPTWGDWACWRGQVSDHVKRGTGRSPVGAPGCGGAGG